MFCICMCKGATWGIYHTSALAACRFGVKGNRPSLSIQHYAQIPLPQLSRLCGQNFPNTSKYIQIHPNTIDSRLCVYTYVHFYKYTYIYTFALVQARQDSGTQMIQMIWGMILLKVYINIKELKYSPKTNSKSPKTNWRDQNSRQMFSSRWMQKCYQLELWSSSKVP